MPTSKFEVSKVKPSNGRFFDATTNSWRSDTPEERVRLGAVKGLQAIYGFRREQISTEEPLWSCGEYKYRADVLLWADDERKRALAVLETKAPGVGLTGEMERKLFSYAECLDPRPALLVLTNRDEARVFRTNDGAQLKRFPSASALAKGFENLAPIPKVAPYRRPKLSPFDVSAAEVGGRLRRDWEIAIPNALASTEVKRAYTALGEILREPPDTMNLAAYRPKLGKYTLVDDRGVMWTSFGNAGGGRFYGRYRHVVLQTPSGKMRNCCFGISTYAKTSYGAVSSLAVVGGIDGKQSVQLQCDVPGCTFESGYARLLHRGYISLGEGGRIDADEVTRAVRRRAPDLLGEDGILAAELSRENLRGVAARKVVLRLAVLADVLDRVRQRVRERRRQLAA